MEQGNEVIDVFPLFSLRCVCDSHSALMA